MNKELGSLVNDIKTNDDEIQALVVASESIDRKLNSFKEKIRGHRRLKERIELIEKVQMSMDLYQEQLIHAKIERLQNRFVESFNTLLRKKNYIKKA